VATIIQAVSAALISDGAAKAGVAGPAIARMIGAANVAARKERARMIDPGCCCFFDRLLGLIAGGGLNSRKKLSIGAWILPENRLPLFRIMR
jgi:hypothetical protein